MDHILIKPKHNAGDPCSDVGHECYPDTSKRANAHAGGLPGPICYPVLIKPEIALNESLIIPKGETINGVTIFDLNVDESDTENTPLVANDRVHRGTNVVTPIGSDPHAHKGSHAGIESGSKSENCKLSKTIHRVAVDKINHSEEMIDKVTIIKAKIHTELAS